MLVDYEERIFLNSLPDKYVALYDLIEKTQLQGRLYDRVQYGEQEIRYPRPFSFSLEPETGHPNYGKSSAKRVLCLYDNAGEHFLPGQDNRGQPGTRHLAESSFLLFLFDPTQDPRWHGAIRQRNPEARLPVAKHSGRQEGILREAAARIRRLKGIADGVKYERPLFVVLNKADVWRGMLDKDALRVPFVPSKHGVDSINIAAVNTCSKYCRNLLLEYIPEVVYAAESFCDTVFYLPASALGKSPQIQQIGYGARQARRSKALVGDASVLDRLVTRNERGHSQGVTNVAVRFDANCLRALGKRDYLEP